MSLARLPRTNWAMLARRSAEATADWLLPSSCLACGAPGELLCAPCRADAGGALQHCCQSCALPLPRDIAGPRAVLCGNCLRRPPAYDSTIAAMVYEPPVDRILMGLKYGARLTHARLLAQLLAQRVAERRDDLPDLLIPVPLHRERLAERGFNQAVEIARPLGRWLGVRVELDSVLRIRATASQAGLALIERRRNMRAAFALRATAEPDMAGRCVGVVDDVMTTGATLNELAKTLKRAGAVRVINLIAARTP